MMNKCYIIILSIAKSGGTERATVNLANMLTDMGYKVSIVSIYTDAGLMPYYPLSQDVELFHLNLERIPPFFSGKITWYYKLYKELNSLISDGSLIIGTGHDINATISFLRHKNRKIVGCEHIQKDMLPGLSRLIMRMTYPKLDCLVLLSVLAKEKYKKYNKRTAVIPNALPFEATTIKSVFNKQIIMVGRFDINKGYGRAIPIFCYLKEKYPDWDVHIYGDGEEKDNVENVIKSNMLSNVNIHMPVKNIADKYSESSIMLMTSYSEAMPMVILEANSYGVPVVAYENEGTKELIKNGRTGFVINSNDNKSFCDHLSFLLDNDDNLKAFSNASFHYAKQFSKDRVSLQWKNLLESIV